MGVDIHYVDLHAFIIKDFDNNIFTVEYAIPLTITARDQTNHTYTGSALGENNKTYTDASVIEQKVTVGTMLENDSLTSITLNGTETEVGEYPDAIMPSAAGLPDYYKVQYEAGKLTINPGAEHTVSYSCTGEVPDEYSPVPPGDASYGAGEKVDLAAVPQATGYNFSGWTSNPTVTVTDGVFTMPAGDVTFTGSWTADYTIHHYFKGTTDQVKDDQTGSDGIIGNKVQAALATKYGELDVEPVKNSETEFTITADGRNEFIVYYTIPVTIHHYLKGTTVSVKDDEIRNAQIGGWIQAIEATEYEGKQLSLVKGSSTLFRIQARGKNEYTLEYTLPLTITANPQTYVYNGNKQGDSDVVYSKPEEQGKVMVSGLLGSDTLATIIVFSQEKELGVYTGGVQPSNATIQIGGGEAVGADDPDESPAVIGYYTVTYVPGDLSITGKLTLNKTTSGGITPDGAKFTVTGPNDYSEEFAYSDFSEEDKLEITILSAGDYTVTETNAAVDDYALKVEYDPRTVTFGEIQEPAPGIVSEAEIKITNTYTKRDPEAATYAVTYAYDGPCPEGADAQLPAQKNYEPGESVDVAAAPFIDGYDFSGWTTSDATVTRGNFTMPEANVVFKGAWKPTYTIHHYMKGTNEKVADDVTGCAKVGDSGDIAYAASYKGIALTPVSGSPKKWSVTSEGDNVFVVEYTIPLTITPKAQTYAYDGKEKGENNKTYTSAADIASKVDVKGLLDGDKLTSITLNGTLTKLGTATLTPSAVGISFNAVKKNDAARSNAAERNAEDTGYYAVKYEAGTLSVTGKLILTKTTTGSTTPKGATFKVTGPNSYNATFKYSEFKSDKLEITGLSAGEYKVEEDKDSAKVSGYDLTVAYDKQTATISGSTPAPEIKITNTYSSGGGSGSSDDSGDSEDDDEKDEEDGDDPEEPDQPDDDDDGPDEPMVEIDGEKIWEDFGNAYHTRPGDVDIRLYANGELVEDADFHWVSREGDTWQFTFGEMPASIDGESVVYSVQEAPVDDYDPVYSGMTVTNRLSSKKVSGYVVISGQKSWLDDPDSQKPGYIVMRLLRNGEPIAQRTSTAANGWTYSFGEQPLDDGYGHDYTYEVREDSVHGYFAMYDGNNVTNISLLGASNGDVGTSVPDLEDVTQEELETLVKVDGYATPLSGELLPTGDETPLYPFAFALAGLLALLSAAMIDGKRRVN